MWVKRTALRLPDAAQPWQGCEQPEGVWNVEPLRLLLVGESTVAGVGVDSQAEALAGQLARQLAQATGRAVEWRACGRNGVRAAECRSELLPAVSGQRWDLVVLVLGVNDTTHLTPRWRWRTEVSALITALGASGAQVLVSAVPPLGQFRALPQPLRAWFGLRAGLLDADLRRLVAHSGAAYCTLDIPFQAHYLARDGYHPSAEGYRLWAGSIVRQWLALES
ncbi:SGNH/GDSL hydrolase family protein [Halopseudomonas phragmitis]|uniref:SGNH/GDSL hydrolase family protein n=1 Tax=Pseudomonadaceae TaxID=135621 RepID=UPI001E4E7BB0|nr:MULTISPECIES: SGNH/GDSL hydrolase family protein [Pseudomonadaceae]